MKNPHAVALGKLGGKARALKTTREERSQWARLGGNERAKRHSRAELSSWAKLGGRPRMPWNQLSDAGKRARTRRAKELGKRGK